MPAKLVMLLLICISSVEDVTKKTLHCICFTHCICCSRGVHPSLPSHRSPHAGAQRGVCRHEIPGMDRWEQPEQHLRTCFFPDGNPQVSSAFPQTPETHPPPKNSASCSCFCFAIKRQENSSSYHPYPEWKSSFPHVHCCSSQMPFAFLLFSKYLPQLSRVGQT